MPSGKKPIFELIMVGAFSLVKHDHEAIAGKRDKHSEEKAQFEPVNRATAKIQAEIQTPHDKNP